MHRVANITQCRDWLLNKVDSHNMHVTHLDISHNLLSGHAPYNLWRLDIDILDLAGNRLDGPIPMLRPDCEFWLGSVDDVHGLVSTSYAARWVSPMCSNPLHPPFNCDAGGGERGGISMLRVPASPTYC